MSVWMAQSKMLFSYYKQCKLKIEAVNVLIKAECTPYTSYKIKLSVDMLHNNN